MMHSLPSFLQDWNEKLFKQSFCYSKTKGTPTSEVKLCVDNEYDADEDHRYEDNACISISLWAKVDALVDSR